MPKTHRKKSLYDAYRFPGFTPLRELKGVFGEPGARVIRLKRRSKKQFAGRVERLTEGGTINAHERRAIFRAETTRFICSWMFDESPVGNVSQ